MSKLSSVGNLHISKLRDLLRQHKKIIPVFGINQTDVSNHQALVDGCFHNDNEI